MDDQLNWQRTVTMVGRKYDTLAGDVRSRLDELLCLIMNLKQQLYDLSFAAGSSSICRECGGACCLNGKYHVSALDLLVYRSAMVEPVIPDFNNHPLCPYGGGQGCNMPPRFRSMTCLVFNCELVEERMEPRGRECFTAVELKLRAAIRGVEELLEYRAGRAALLSCQE